MRVRFLGRMLFPRPELCIALILKNYASGLSAINALSDLGFDRDHVESASTNSTDPCSIRLVESIPEGVPFTASLSTFDAWSELLESAKRSIDISAVYFTLRSEEALTGDVSDEKGRQIYRAIADAARRGVKVRTITNPGPRWKFMDAESLAADGAMELRLSEAERLTGGGINHAKFILVDEEHFYIGSANMDWRALTQIREVGYLAKHCRLLALDLAKIFNSWWILAEPNATLPRFWTQDLFTDITRLRPVRLDLNGSMYRSYIAAAPKAFTAPRREWDLDAIIAGIREARGYIHIEVLTYLPILKYRRPTEYWQTLDDALRIAAVRGVKVKLLIGQWQRSIGRHLPFLRSLDAFRDIFGNGSIEVRMFVVPSSPEQADIPFARINHAKFMVTDKAAYIGTSNWTKDYFIGTTGVGFVLMCDENGATSGPVEDLRDVFLRDWYSPYALPLPQVAEACVPSSANGTREDLDEE